MSLVSDMNLINILADFKNNSIPSMKYGINIQNNSKSRNFCRRRANIPFPFYFSYGATIGDYIYLFGSYDENYRRMAYKYNVKTDQYTRIADIPFDFYSGAVCVCNGNIILCKSDETTTDSTTSFTYSYNPSTNTYTALSRLPYWFFESVSLCIGNKIYYLGTNKTPQYKYNYEYDSITGTYTKKADIPYMFVRGTGVALYNRLYLIGGSYSQNYNTQYDPDTDTYTRMTDLPYNMNWGDACVHNVYGQDIIFIFGGSNSKQIVYDYSPLINSYYKQDNLDTVGLVRGYVEDVDGTIYIVGGDGTSQILCQYLLKNNIRYFVKPTGYKVYISNGESYEGDASCIVKYSDLDFCTVYNDKNQVVYCDYPLKYNERYTRLYTLDNSLNPTLNGKLVMGSAGWNVYLLSDFF